MAWYFLYYFDLDSFVELDDSPHIWSELSFYFMADFDISLCTQDVVMNTDGVFSRHSFLDGKMALLLPFMGAILLGSEEKSVM